VSTARDNSWCVRGKYKLIEQGVLSKSQYQADPTYRPKRINDAASCRYDAIPSSTWSLHVQSGEVLADGSSWLVMVVVLWQVKQGDYAD
jgi:hypothetical protein